MKTCANELNQVKEWLVNKNNERLKILGSFLRPWYFKHKKRSKIILNKQYLND
jgi:hypothetical protein